MCISISIVYSEITLDLSLILLKLLFAFSFCTYNCSKVNVQSILMKICARSSWRRQYMVRFDLHPGIDHTKTILHHSNFKQIRTTIFV